MKVLVTGANGFVGAAVVRALRDEDHVLRAAVRARLPGLALEQAVVGDIGSATDWSGALDGVDAVVHLAARVHVMRADVQGETGFERVNVGGTLALAQAAAAARVRRFIYVSSIKVNGERTTTQPFRASDQPAPEDAYARSKLAAERALQTVAGLEPVILRPTLICGPGAKGNLARLCRLAESGVPLPLGSVTNRRDLTSVDNFAQLVARCLVHPAAAGRTFLVSDGEALSTPELYRTIAAALGRPARLLPFPVTMLRSAANVLGLGGEVARLTESLEVDIAATMSLLDWRPAHSPQHGLAEMARSWRAARQ